VSKQWFRFDFSFPPFKKPPFILFYFIDVWHVTNVKTRAEIKSSSINTFVMKNKIHVFPTKHTRFLFLTRTLLPPLSTIVASPSHSSRRRYSVLSSQTKPQWIKTTTKIQSSKHLWIESHLFVNQLNNCRAFTSFSKFNLNQQ